MSSKKQSRKHIVILQVVAQLIKCIHPICDAIAAYQSDDYATAAFKMLVVLKKLLFVIGFLSKKKR